MKIFHDDTENELITYSFRIELGQAFINMDHPHVLKISGAGRGNFIFGEETLGERNYIVSEICPNGELFEFV